MFKYYVNVYKFCLRSNGINIEGGIAENNKKFDKAIKSSNEINIRLSDLSISDNDADFIKEKKEEIKNLKNDISLEAKQQIDFLQNTTSETLRNDLKNKGVTITSMESLKILLDTSGLNSNNIDNKTAIEITKSLDSIGSSIKIGLNENNKIVIKNTEKGYLDKTIDLASKAFGSLIPEVGAGILPDLNNLPEVKKHIDSLKIKLPEGYSIGIGEGKNEGRIVLKGPNDKIRWFTPGKSENINMLTEIGLQKFVDKYHSKWGDIQKNK